MITFMMRIYYFLIFSILMSHLTLVTSETPWLALLTPLLTTLNSFFLAACIPAWSAATWFTVFLYGTTIPLLSHLMEGGWGLVLRWILATEIWMALGILALYQHKPHQVYSKDVRLWIPTAILIDTPGCLRYSNAWFHPRHVISAFGHHQYGIRLRVRYNYFSLQIKLPTSKLLSLATLIRRYMQRYHHRQKLATSDQAGTSYFDHKLYDKATERYTKFHNDVKPVVQSHFDHAYYDKCISIWKESTTVIEQTYFDSELYDRALASRESKLNDQSKFQDDPSFLNEYGVTKAIAWEIFDGLIDPLDWFLKERNLWKASMFDTAGQRQFSTGNPLQDATNLQAYLIPKLALCSRTESLANSSMAHALLLDPSKPISESTPIVLDTGASISCTPFADDFVTPLQPVKESLVGLDDVIAVEGVGEVEWTIRDCYGRVACIRTAAYLVPKAGVRLFSPQTYFKENKANAATQARCEFDHEKIKLYTVQGNQLVFPFSEGNNLPYMLTDNFVMPGSLDSHDHFNLKCGPILNSILSEARDTLQEWNHNLDGPTKELLLIHRRYGHIGMAWAQELMRPPPHEVGTPKAKPFFSTRNETTKKVPHPKCAACLLARQPRRGAGSSVTRNKPELEMAIRRNDLAPGQRVSTDQYVSAKAGRLPHTFGKEHLGSRYSGGTVFIDHGSSYVFINHQVSLASGETIQSKHKFENFARSYGVKIKAYHADNHPYRSEAFLEDLQMQDQRITFSGVGAHHQNGAAERILQTITTWARAMMMHQLLHWPEQYNETNWPFALDHAVYLWNNLPRDRNGLTPLEVFTGVHQQHNDEILRAKVWGCPAYVLDPKLQDGHKLPKWKRRSHCGMYLGSSFDHAESVGRILNIRSGAVSPQFHVVYDELFTTMSARFDELPLTEQEWNDLLRLGPIYAAADDKDNPHVKRVAQDLYDTFEDPDRPPAAPPPPIPPVPEGEDEFWPEPNGGTSDSEGASASEGARPITGRKVRMIDELADWNNRGNHEPQHRTRSPQAPIHRRTRSGKALTAHAVGNLNDYRSTLQDQGRPRYQRQQYLAGGNPQRRVRDRELDNARLHKIDWNPTTLLSSVPNGPAREILHEVLLRQPLGDWHPMALQAKKNNDPDLPGWEEAMNGPYAEGYMEAATKEINTLRDMKVWDVVDREEWMSVLPSTWAFRRKTFPDGTTKKLKGRFCVRGDREVAGVHYDPTRIFSPVVSWTTVRLMLLLSAQLELATRQVDYVAAFVHSPVPLPENYDDLSPDEQKQSRIYVDMPRGFKEHGKVLRLNKALYGLKSAPKAFFNHLKANLEAIGFRQAIEVDACLFISEKVICLTYVDDTLLYAEKDEYIDEVLRRLQEERQMSLEVEDDVAGFLGVDIKKDPTTGNIILKQIGLKKKIIEALQIDDLPAVYTPADTVLGKDEDGEPCHGNFNMSSIVGMAFYLYSHSCPEIGFAISQLARFTFNPKRSHELAAIRLGQYLKGTLDQGMILKPTKFDEFRMDVYVDSDFMGLYGKERRDDPDNVKCRGGYVILLNDCPVIWKSSLLDAVTTSTMMAEYYALSNALREVLPLRDLVKTVAKGTGISQMCTTTFKCTAHEDNTAAETLANLEPGRVTPRSKHYDNKVHWFRSWLSSPDAVEVKGGICVVRVDTKLQLADIYTKPLPREDFERLRKLIVGW